MRRTLVLAVLGVLVTVAAVARAAPEEADALARQGLEAAEAGDHARAVKLLAAARQANPHEGNVLEHLARELFAVKDYVRAAEAAKAALAEVRDWSAPKMTLANILEATGKRAEAAAAYEALFVESHELDMQALARLGALDPKRADALRKPKFLDGPFPTVDAWCEKQNPACDDDGTFGALGGVTFGDGAADNPLHAARVVSFVSSPGTGSHRVDGCAVALAVDNAWWVGPLIKDCAKLGGGIQFIPATRELALGEVFSLWLRVARDSRKFGVFSDDPPADHHIVCGVGPSKKPSCVEDWRVRPTFRAFP
jgi:hypothetical protein